MNDAGDTEESSALFCTDRFTEFTGLLHRCDSRLDRIISEKNALLVFSRSKVKGDKRNEKVPDHYGGGTAGRHRIHGYCLGRNELHQRF